MAEAIEYSTTAIYSHFADKQALVDALTDHDFAAHSKTFAQCASIADPVERLRRAGELYLEFGIENPHHYQVIFMTRVPNRKYDPSPLPEKIPSSSSACWCAHASIVVASSRSLPT